MITQVGGSQCEPVHQIKHVAQLFFSTLCNILQLKNELLSAFKWTNFVLVKLFLNDFKGITSRIFLKKKQNNQNNV